MSSNKGERSEQLEWSGMTLDQAGPEAKRCATEIAKTLDGLPLALDQAGVYLQATGCSLATYQQVYEQHRAELLKERRNAVYPASVATTWVISFERGEQENPARPEDAPVRQ
jgi:hypothetical protein